MKATGQMGVRSICNKRATDLQPLISKFSILAIYSILAATTSSQRVSATLEMEWKAVPVDLIVFSSKMARSLSSGSHRLK